MQVQSARCFVCVASDVKGADLALWWAGRWHCRNTRDVNPDVEQAGRSAIGTKLHAVGWYGGLRRKERAGVPEKRTLNAAEQALASGPPLAPLGPRLPWTPDSFHHTLPSLRYQHMRVGLLPTPQTADLIPVSVPVPMT